MPDGSVKLGFRAHYPQLETKLTARGRDMDDIRRKLEPVEREVRKRVGNFILGEDDQTLEGVILEGAARARRARSRWSRRSRAGRWRRGSPTCPAPTTVFRRGVIARALPRGVGRGRARRAPPPDGR